jgi:hypothetical protein
MYRPILLLLCFTSLYVKADASVQTRIAWVKDSECIEKKTGVGAAAAIFIPLVIDAVVDHAAASLKAATGEKTQQFPLVVTTENFYKLLPDGDLAQNSKSNCLVVVRGEFEGGGDDAMNPLAGLKNSNPFLLFKAIREGTSNPEYFKLQPVYFKAGKLEPGNIWSRTGDYTISVSMYAPGEASPFGSTTFTFEKIKEGMTFGATDARLVYSASDPIKHPGMLEDANAVKNKLDKKLAPQLLALGVLNRKEPAQGKPNPLDITSIQTFLSGFCDAEAADNAKVEKKFRVRSERCSVEKNKKLRMFESQVANADALNEVKDWAHTICPAWKPSSRSTCVNEKDKKNPTDDPAQGYGLFVTKVVLTESREANEFGQKLAAVLGAATDDIKKELKGQLPEAKKSAKDTKDTEGRKEDYVYALAYLKWEAADRNYKNSSLDDKLAARISLVEACYAANEAGVPLGKAPVCPQYE